MCLKTAVYDILLDIFYNSCVLFVFVSCKISFFDSMKIATVGTIGAGTMGAGIALVAAQAGKKVVVYDTNKVVLENAQKYWQSTIDRLIEKGKLTAEEGLKVGSNLMVTMDLFDLSKADLIIEAIIENMEVKKSLFSELSSVVSSNTILASNTSSLSITAIAAACKNPAQMIGIHFFNPAPLMPLVEVIPALQTDSSVIELVRNEIMGWKKTIVIAKDTPGFIVNRVARAYYGESIRILEEGIANEITIDYAMKTYGGFKMGPFELMDLIGNDINYTVTKTVWEQFFFEPRYQPSLTQKALVDAGRLGKKTGHGYYDYSTKAENLEPNKDVGLAERICNRVLAMLMNEAAETLYLDIASEQ
ncbi:MAG: hypothetical protein RIQ89_352, partial [Bacteroidota bacterium]